MGYNNIISFTENVTFWNFENDKKLRYAVERQIMVIGEAAHHLSDPTKSKYTDIPWKNIVGMRNIIAHEYGEVLTERVWITAITHIPKLMTEISSILQSADEHLN